MDFKSKANLATATRAAESIGLRIDTNGSSSATRGTLRPTSDTYRKYTANGRKVNAVCWHGYVAWLDATFALDASVRIVTSSPTRDEKVMLDADTWRAFARATEEINVGNYYNRLRYCDACECGYTARWNAADAILASREPVNA